MPQSSTEQGSMLLLCQLLCQLVSGSSSYVYIITSNDMPSCATNAVVTISNAFISTPTTTTGVKPLLIDGHRHSVSPQVDFSEIFPEPSIGKTLICLVSARRARESYRPAPRVLRRVRIEQLYATVTDEEQKTGHFKPSGKAHG